MYGNHNVGGGDAQRHTEEERQLQDEEDDERANAEAVGHVAHTISHIDLSRSALLARHALYPEGVMDNEVSNTDGHTAGRQTRRSASQGVELMPPPPQERSASVPLVGNSGQGNCNNTSSLEQEPSAVVQHRTPPSVTVTKIPNNIRNFRAPRKLTGSSYVHPEGSHRNESRTRNFVPHVHVCFAVNSHGEEGEFIAFTKGQYKRIDHSMDIDKPLSNEDRKKVVGHHVNNKELRLFAR